MSELSLDPLQTKHLQSTHFLDEANRRIADHLAMLAALLRVRAKSFGQMHKPMSGEESGNFSGVGYGLLVPVGRWPPPLIEEVMVTTTAAVEWKIAIEGTDAFGEVRRHEIRVDKSWDRLFDGEIGLSVDDGKKIMAALQTAVVSQEAASYTLFRRICPDCGLLRPVKDYTTRRIRTVFGTVEVRNPRWMLCRSCHPGFALAFAPLQEICPDRATSELTELTARLGSAMPYRQAATVMAEFLPVEATETHATVRKRTISNGRETRPTGGRGREKSGLPDKGSTTARTGIPRRSA